MQQFMPDPRLMRSSYASNRNPSLSTEDPNRKGKTHWSVSKPDMSHQSVLQCNEQPVFGIARITKEIPLEVTNIHLNYGNNEVFSQRLPIPITNKPNDSRSQAVTLNVNSFVNDLLDSFQLDTCGSNFNSKDSQQREEGEVDEEAEEAEEAEESGDFPSRIANFQRSLDDVEQYAVALPSGHRPTYTSGTSTRPRKDSIKNSQPTARVKPEPRDTSASSSTHRFENNLKQALADIRQSKMTVTSHSSTNEANSTKSTCSSKTEPKIIANPSTASSHQKPKIQAPSPEPSNKAGRRRRNVVEDPGRSSRNRNRTSRNSSPISNRDRGLPVFGSPEWQRQVRIVDKPDRHGRDSRERELRRVRRIRSRSRSLSRSRSPRRFLRNIRPGSPDRRRTRSRSRSRSPPFRRGHRISRSPDRPFRRLVGGSGRSSRNSRSPPRIRDRRRSPIEYVHRNVIERTVIVRHKSRSHSRSRSHSSSRNSSLKRRKESIDVAHELPRIAEAPPVTSQTPQFFTRGFVQANNQVDLVAQPSHLEQPAPAELPVRYVVPPNQTNVAVNVAPIPLMMNCYNHQQFQPSQQQQMMAAFQQQQFQQQQQHQFHQQQQIQQQQYEQQMYQQQQIQAQQYHQSSQSVLPYIKPLASFNPNIPPYATTDHSSLPPTYPSTSKPVTSNSMASYSETGATDAEQRIRGTRDALLEKQTNLVHQLFIIQGQIADMEMKQKLSDGVEYDRFQSNIIDKAKLEKELTVSAHSLQKILQKHTTQLKEDLSELKKARSSHRYSYFDPGQHWCELCDVITEKLSDYLNHLHSKEHQERLLSTGVPSTPWHKKRPGTEENKTDTRIITRIPFNGLQCLQPVKAWYCEMCDVWMGDVHCAQLHMNSSDHNDLHLKRNMERPDIALNYTIKKQSALRRNMVRKKEDERVKIQKREADRLKIEAKKKEALKKKEIENQEKQKVLNEKWNSYVRQEESSNVGIELEEPTSSTKTTVQQTKEVDSSSTAVSRNIRLNIRTPLTSEKSVEQEEKSPAVRTDSAEQHEPVSTEEKTLTQQRLPVTETEVDISSDSPTQKNAIVENDAGISSQLIVEKPRVDQENDNQPTVPTDVKMSHVMNSATGEKSICSSGVVVDPNDKPQQPPPMLVDESVCPLSNSSNPDGNKMAVDADNVWRNSDSESSKENSECSRSMSVADNKIESESTSEKSGCVEGEKCERIDYDLDCPENMETSAKAIVEPSASTPEQMVPSSEQDATYIPPLLSEKADNAEEKSNQQQASIQELQVNHDGDRSGLDSTMIESLEDDQKISDNSADILNLSQVTVENLDIATSDSGKESQNSNVNTQQEPTSSTENDDEQQKSITEGNERLIPKIEPKDENKNVEPQECCVILEVNPKLNKVVEIIDLESSGDEADHPKGKTSDESAVNKEVKNSTVLPANEEQSTLPISDEPSSTCDKSSPEISVQLSDFIVLSEANDDSFLDPEGVTDSPEAQ